MKLWRKYNLNYPLVYSIICSYTVKKRMKSRRASRKISRNKTNTKKYLETSTGWGCSAQRTFWQDLLNYVGNSKGGF